MNNNQEFIEIDERLAFWFLFPPTLALIMLYMLIEMIATEIKEVL